MTFRNPVNGYTESSSVPFLWCLLFGIFYFMVKGIWRHALISFLIACCTLGLSWLIYPFFAKGIVIASYGRRGWERVN
ncbi:MAG TPA: hypothetical protein VF503_09295 [Sphingobium sp.]|uniref:hypothetical protein n=1 Tax=Sphingobium sp. TaxID=1912891 RepID=UPI002ED01CE7